MSGSFEQTKQGQQGCDLMRTAGAHIILKSCAAGVCAARGHAHARCVPLLRGHRTHRLQTLFSPSAVRAARRSAPVRGAAVGQAAALPFAFHGWHPCTSTHTVPKSHRHRSCACDACMPTDYQYTIHNRRCVRTEGVFLHRSDTHYYTIRNGVLPRFRAFGTHSLFSPRRRHFPSVRAQEFVSL